MLKAGTNIKKLRTRAGRKAINSDCEIMFYISAGVYLSLRGRTNFSGGIVPINVIGVTTIEITHPNVDAENNGLQCVTNKPNCYRVGTRIRIGEWYFPNGTAVPILGHENNRATTFFSKPRI